MLRKRILIADRNPSMLEMVRDLLWEEFEILGTAQSGHAAVKLCAALKPDLVILDIALEDMTGFELAERVKQAAPEIKTIYFSMFESTEFVESAFAYGASAYVFKSRDEDLLPAVRKVAAGGMFRCSLPAMGKAQSR